MSTTILNNSETLKMKHRHYSREEWKMARKELKGNKTRERKKTKR